MKVVSRFRNLTLSESIMAYRAPHSTEKLFAVIGGILVGLLSACSSTEFSSPYIPPSAPTAEAVIRGARIAAAEEKLTSPLEISEVRPTDHGPGNYFVCLKEAGSSGRSTTYSVFWNNDSYMGVRHSAILEACASQVYSAISELPPSPAAVKRVQ